MGDLLKSILSLRDEINKLNEFSNEKAYEYCELGIKIADIQENIITMSNDKSNLEKQIYDFKYKKSLLFTAPIGISIIGCYFTFLVFNYWDKLTFSTSLLAIIGTPTFGGALAMCVSSLLVYSKKFNIFLTRKYTFLKEMNEKFNTLIDKINKQENCLICIKKSQEEITSIIANNEEILENKRDELNKLEEEYFNNLLNKPSMTPTTYVPNSNGKKRTRTIGNIDHYY